VNGTNGGSSNEQSLLKVLLQIETLCSFNLFRKHHECRKNIEYMKEKIPPQLDRRQGGNVCNSNTIEDAVDKRFYPNQIEAQRSEFDLERRSKGAGG